MKDERMETSYAAEQEIVRFTLTAGELLRLVESLAVILAIHRDDDIADATITLERPNVIDSNLMVLVRKYDGNAAEDPPLARYVVDQLGMRDDLAPLKRVGL
jgi:hypothetical protein